MKKTFTLLLLAFHCILLAQAKTIRFVNSYDGTADKPGWYKLGGSKVSLNVLDFRGGCCDCPAAQLMNGEIANDTLYVDTAIEKHDLHDVIGICGTRINVVLDSVDFPNYRKLIIAFKELKSTASRKVPHIKN